MLLTIPKVLTQRGTDPKFTTEDYWERFQYSIITTIKTKPDRLLDKQKKVAAATDVKKLTDDETMYLEVLKSAFLCSKQLDLAVATTHCVRSCPAGLRHFFLLGKVALTQGDFT